jgi:hypothetical protein
VQLIPIRVSAIVQTLAFALCVSVLALVPMAPVDAQKGKPSYPLDATASVVLADGFAVTSDGNGPYTGATVFGPSGDLRLDLTTGTREILVQLGEPVQIPAPPVAQPAPGTYYTDAGLFIQDIRSVAKGSTVRRVGRIGFGNALPDHALGFRYTTVQGIVINGTDACVRRLTNAEAATTTPTWRITSSAGCAGADADKAGVFEENIKGKINHKWTGTYTVPFSITVTCSTNCVM